MGRKISYNLVLRSVPLNLFLTLSFLNPWCVMSVGGRGTPLLVLSGWKGGGYPDLV